jgi:hypothetical protein
MKNFPYESVREAGEAYKEARQELLQSINIQELPVEVIEYMTKVTHIIGSLVERSVIDARRRGYCDD